MNEDKPYFNRDDEPIVAGEAAGIKPENVRRLERELHNETTMRKAAEARIETFVETVNEQETRIATAWRERDAALRERMEVEKLLRDTTRLLTWFASR